MWDAEKPKHGKNHVETKDVVSRKLFYLALVMAGLGLVVWVFVIGYVYNRLYNGVC